MADSPASPQPGSSRLFRKIGIAVALLLILAVIFYFVASSWFVLRTVVLPRVGRAVNAEITATGGSFRPFSELVLTGVKVQPAGAEPLLTAEQLRVRYNLNSILHGRYVVNELTIVSPTIQLVTDPSGASNLDPMTKSEQARAPSTKPAAPLQVALRNISVKNGVLRKIDRAKDGSVKTLELRQLDLSVDRIENGQPGKVKLASTVSAENAPPRGKAGTNDTFEGTANGSFDYRLDSNLKPQTVSGMAKTIIARAAGSYAQLAGLSAVVQADVTPAEVRQLALRFERGGQALGRIQAAGPFDVARAEGRLTLAVESIDRQLLNILGARQQWDFADSRLDATNVVKLAQQGQVIEAKGRITGQQFTIRQPRQSIPPVDLNLEYELQADLKQQTGLLSTLSLAGKQQNKEFLRASLDRPMPLDWGPTSHGLEGSAFQLALSDVNLEDWRFLLGTNVFAGRLDWQLKLTATNGARLLIANSTASVSGFAAEFGTNRVDQAQVDFAFDGTLEDFKNLNLRHYTLQMRQRNEPLAQAEGSLRGDLSGQDLALQTRAQLVLPALLRQFPVPQLTASAGRVAINTTASSKNTNWTAKGTLTISDFTGRYGSYSFQNLESGLEYDFDLHRPMLKINNSTLQIASAGNPGGKLSLTGDYDLDNKAAQLSFKADDLNENALGPFLAPSLGDKKLVSMSLTGTGAVRYDPNAETSLKTDLSVTNLAVTAPQQSSPPPKLSAQLQLDATRRNELVDLRQFALKLSPTPRAKNELQAKARFDFAKTNAKPSELTLTADSLDLTPYYDLFVNRKTTNAPNPARQGPAQTKTPARPGEVSEAAPPTLPMSGLNADVRIGRFYLRQVVISNLQATAVTRGDEITLRPVQLSLNGAPVSANATVNVAVPGYAYDVSFQADHVPLEPLAASFTTNAPGQDKGDLIAQAHVKGTGLTSPTLQKNLAGDLSLTLTNMSYEIVGAKTKRLIEPIALVLRLPELTQTPINWINAVASIGQGRVDLQQFTVQSQAFYAASHGVIPLADALTNSPLNLPVELSIRRSLAEKGKILPPETPTNAPYAPLPTFVTLRGTIGDPKTEINKLVVSGLLAKSIGGIAPVGEKASSILQSLGGILTGQPARSAAGKTNAPAGNGPATNASPVSNLIEGISNLLNPPKKARTSTNAPSGATNSPTAGQTNRPSRISPLDLLNQLQNRVNRQDR